MTMRWGNLVRHGLLGGSLLAAAAGRARAETCRNTGRYGGDTETVVAVMAGIDIAPKAAVIGGLELRHCVADNAEVMVRLEHGGGGTRVIAGGRVRPWGAVEDHWEDGAIESLGVEAGLALDDHGGWGLHVAGTKGRNYLYAAVEALFPLTSRDPLATTRVSLVGGVAPWSIPSNAVDGRPITIDGRIVTPAIVARAAVRGAEERAVADHFARSARFESSSVWTFLRLAAELHAAGAPAHLIAAALDAADDEVRHAELCAQAAGGLALAPLPSLAAQPRFTCRTPAALALLAAEAWTEGCLNEGIAAEQARLAADDADDPIRTMLATIARDEATHAALAWAVLAWVHAVAPAVARDAIARLAPAPGPSLPPSDRALARRGVPSAAVLAAAHADASSAAAGRLRALLA